MIDDRKTKKTRATVLKKHDFLVHYSEVCSRICPLLKGPLLRGIFTCKLHVGTADFVHYPEVRGPLLEGNL